MRNTRQIGQILVELGYITQEQLVRAVMEQKDTGERLGTILLRRGNLTTEQLTEALALQTGMEYVRLDVAEVQPEAIAELSPALAWSFQMLPVRVENGRLLIAPLDIHHTKSLQEMYRMFGKPISLVCANPATVEAALRLYYPRDKSDIDFAADYPCIRDFVDNLLKDAKERGAEAVHLEPQDAYTVVVRYRVGGRLETVRQVPGAFGQVAIYRMKKLTGLSLMGSQTHFSGTLHVEHPGGDATGQLSCLQTSCGERAVIRFLPDVATDDVFADLVGDPASALQNILASRGGLFLVAGEDRASCQAVLRSALQSKVEGGAIAFSLDSSVGRGLSGVYHVATEADLPISIESLRAVLMQDPDVVVAGMLEDAAAMQVLVSAAEAGVWVAAAVRSANVTGALDRLHVFGLTPVRVATTLLGIVQVHTLPRLCSSCRTTQLMPLPEWLADEPCETEVYSAAGCEKCRYTGHAGTVSVIEVFSPGAELRDLLIRGVASHETEKAVRPHLQSAFRATLRQKVLSGQISLQHAQLLWERQHPLGMQSIRLAA